MDHAALGHVLGNMESLRYLYPELIMMLFTVFAVVADLVFPKQRAAATCAVTLAGLGLALGSIVPYFGSGAAGSASTFMGTMAHDDLGTFFKGYLIVSAIIVALSAMRSREVSHVPQGEFFSLILAVTAAGCLLATSVDLLMVYLSLEMVSITSYVMVGTSRGERISNEGALKYLLFGAVAAGAMLYGISLIYGLTGTTNLYGVQQALATTPAGQATTLTLLVAGTLILAGFGFKIASVPFHFWCPDVYQGAPTPVTALLSVGPKAAGFAVLIRFFFPAAQGALARNLGNMGATLSGTTWVDILLSLSLVTMTVGNVAALTQRNMKRLLAYSSIAHAGYMLMGLVLFSQEGAKAILIYLVVYLFMNIGAFLVVIAVHDSEGSFDVTAFNGLFRRNPFLAVSMTVFLLSLIGFPPFSGFMGKLYLFMAVLQRGKVLLAVVGALNSVVAVWYYVRVMRAMIIDEQDRPGPLAVAPWNTALIALMVVPNCVLILLWKHVDTFASVATRTLAAVSY
ncbi:MAG: NADH-quinone oxidoreductase subunit N [Acidobacteriota bacterium]